MRVFFAFVVVTLISVTFFVTSQGVPQGIPQDLCQKGLVQIYKPGDGHLNDTSCVTPDVAERFSALGWQTVGAEGNTSTSMVEEASEEVAEETEVAEEVIEEAEEVVEETEEAAEEVAEEVVEEAEEVVEETEEAAEEVAEEVVEEAKEVVEETEEAAEEVAEEAIEGVAPALVSGEWQELGETTFGVCSSCHQADGMGLPAFYPALAGHIPNVEAKEGGRAYIINVVLFGLSGQIETLGETYNGMMSPWNAMFSDEEIAAVLNHELHSWGNADMLRADFTPITADEVAAERAVAKTSDEVYELRSHLGLTADE